MDIPKIDELQAEFDRGVEQVRVFLRSEQGERARRQVAGALIAGAPFVAYMAGKRLPFLGRVLETAGVAAIVVKAGEKIRDWEPPAASA